MGKLENDQRGTVGHKDQRYDEGYKKIGRNKGRLHNRAGEPSRADVMIPVG